MYASYTALDHFPKRNLSYHTSTDITHKSNTTVTRNENLPVFTGKFFFDWIYDFMVLIITFSFSSAAYMFK